MPSTPASFTHTPSVDQEIVDRYRSLCDSTVGLALANLLHRHLGWEIEIEVEPTQNGSFKAVSAWVVSTDDVAIDIEGPKSAALQRKGKPVVLQGLTSETIFKHLSPEDVLGWEDSCHQAQLIIQSYLAPRYFKPEHQSFFS